MRPIHLPGLAAGVALLLAPAAQAVEFPFGSIVGSSDYDLSPLPSVSGADLRYALCVIDVNGDGAAGAEDHILLVTKVATAGVCPASVAANGQSALLLNTVGGLVAGSEVKVAHDIAGSALSITGPAPGQFAHALRYYEDGTDASKLDAKDTLYVDLVDLGTPTVSPGDLRITTVTTPKGTFAGGQLVKPGDGDESRLLANIRPATAPATKLASTASMVYKAGSGYYVNSDAGALMGVSTCAALPCTPSVTGDVGVESGDIRLNPKAANPLSDTAIVLPDKVEILQAKVAPGQPFQVKVTAKNTGRGAGAGLVETRIDGAVADARGTPTIEPNGAATLVLTLIAPATPGQHIVKSGTFADFLTVGAPAETVDLAALQGQVADLQAQVAQMEPAGHEESRANVPGVGPAAVLLGLALLAVASRRAP